MKTRKEKFVNLKEIRHNKSLKIFKTRGLSVGGSKKASGLAFFINRLTKPEMVETYKRVSTVESPLLVNNWRPRPPFFYFTYKFYFLYSIIFIVNNLTK